MVFVFKFDGMLGKKRLIEQKHIMGKAMEQMKGLQQKKIKSLT